jgi:hygromycin-B 7''-O-kinase
VLPVPRSWAAWGRIFTDVELWRPVVRQICATTGTAEGYLVEAGFPGSCAVFVVDRRVVVKIFPPQLGGDHDRELEAYRLLTGRLSPFLPVVLAHGVHQDRIAWPYLVVSFLPGRPLLDVRPDLSADDEERIGQAVGRAVRQIHATPLTAANHFQPSPAAWSAFVRRRKVAALRQLRSWQILSAELVKQLAVSLASEPGPLGPLRLLHADLTADHLLLDEANGQWQVTGLIDYADCQVGEAVYEWIALWFGLCARRPAFFRAVLRGYDPALVINDALRRRLFHFTFIHRFGPEMVRLTLAGQDPAVIGSLEQLQRVLWPGL